MKSSFILDGKPFSSVRGGPPQIVKAKQFLDRQKDGLLLSGAELAKALGFGQRGFLSTCHTYKDFLDGYFVKVRYPSPRTVWGSRKTIAELRKHKEIIIA
jgi:hypothetical protein